MMNKRRREEIQERRQERSKEIEERRNTPEETRKDEESIKEVDEENIRRNGIREVEGQEKRYIGEEERNDGESEETWKVAFWNVAGLSNKDKDFWEGIKEWDVIVMMETWTDEKGWEKVKEKLSREFRWRVQIATRRNKKGRACGGMLLGIRKSIEEIKERRETEEEGKIEGKIRIGEEVWRIIGIYVNNNIDEKLKGLKERTEKGEKGVRTIIGGDFNARTGEEEGWEEEIERRKERGRKSKDKKINKEGRKLLEFIEERGCMILNGGTKGDEEGEYTYTGGRGETVIDYIIGDEEVREKVERLEVGERIDSDHHPLILWVKGSSKRRQRRRGTEKMRRRGVWNDEGKTQFREKLGAIGGKRDLQEEIEEGTRKIRRVIEENEDKNERVTIKNKRGWWDEECTESKREVRKELRKWRKGKEEAERYRERRKEYREMCDRKKKEEKERMIREIGEAKTEGKVWELIGRVRKRRRRVNEEIKPEEWKEYFIDLMGGVENRVVKGEGNGSRQEEEEIGLEEIRNVIKKLKTGKAIGNDGIPNEAWKYGEEEMVKWIWEVCKRVWRGEGWPEQWKEGEIIPLIKKGEEREVKDYRGITIMSSMYKIYTAILAERIREE
ncbi:trichohyalin-like, partial [Temnothorax curvispinosus]|uniref:Trichohyalin-like n=1 Tax=Temnothorax curvispinosus TaxID=300111 RepID=A0A6J1R9G9_9HYME